MIDTPRLKLVPLSPSLVAALVEGDIDRAAALAPFPVDADTFAEDGYVLALRHAQLTADPAEEPWLYRAAVSTATGEVVGRIGFHAPPDADATVEVGYTVAPEHRRQGLALEMCSALFAWGAEHGARRVLASVRPDNAASLAVVARLGFVRVGEEWDDVDGLEWVHALDVGAPGGAAGGVPTR